MNYQDAAALLTGRNHTSRKLANNTYLVRKDGDSFAVRLHATDIITLCPSGAVVLNSGGWKTPTTKARINDYAPAPVQIHQNKGLWYYRDGSLFQDGDTITGDGKIWREGGAENAPDKQELDRLKKDILKFSKLAAASLPLPEPGFGDCLFCQCEREPGSNDAGCSHLASHLAEGYVVPSLVFRALKDAKAGDLILSATFGHYPAWEDVAGPYVKRAVSSYLKKRFGLAR